MSKTRWDNKRKHKQLMLIQLLIITFLLTGCWSAVEIDDMIFINALAVDLNKKGEYEITAIISNPTTIFSQTFVGKTGGNQRNHFLIETSSGRTIFDAIGKISHSLSEKIYFGHMDAVIFGEKVAREKMVSSLDYFTRGNQFRPNIQLLVAKGKASDIIKNTPEFNTTLGLEIMDYSKPNRYATSFKITDISQFTKVFNSRTSDAATAVIISTKKVPEKEKGVKQKPGNKEPKIPLLTGIDGTAVFKDSNLIGFFNQQETHGLFWIRGKMKNEVVPISCGKYNNGYVSVVIRENDSQYIPHINNKNQEITVKTTVEAEIGEITCSSLNLNSENIEYLNKQLEKHIKHEATAALNKAQKQWEADVFGFGQAIYREYPLEWNQFASNWKNGVLKDLKVNLKVKANLSRYGLRKDPVKENEAR